MSEATSQAQPESGSKPQTIREFERALLTLGFSKREAKAIASSGFKATQPTDELADQLDAVAEAITRLQRTLKE